MSTLPSEKCGHGQGNPRNCPECRPELFSSNEHCYYNRGGVTGKHCNFYPKCVCGDQDALRGARKQAGEASVGTVPSASAAGGYSTTPECGREPPNNPHAPETPQPAAKELTEALSYEGQKDAWLDNLLTYLHFDPVTKSHPDWVARAQEAEARLARLLAHKWDVTGERCTVCGDKDWMGGPCRGPDDTGNKQDAPETSDTVSKAAQQRLIETTRYMESWQSPESFNYEWQRLIDANNAVIRNCQSNRGRPGEIGGGLQLGTNDAYCSQCGITHCLPVELASHETKAKSLLIKSLVIKVRLIEQYRGALMMISEGKCPSLARPMTPQQIALAALKADDPLATSHEHAGVHTNGDPL